MILSLAFAYSVTKGNCNWCFSTPYKGNMSHFHIIKGQESLLAIPSLQKSPDPELSEEEIPSHGSLSSISRGLMERIRREGKRTKGRKMKCTVRMPREPKNTLYIPKEIFLLHCHGPNIFKSRKLSWLPVKTKLLIINLGTEEKSTQLHIHSLNTYPHPSPVQTFPVFTTVYPVPVKLFPVRQHAA